MSVVKAANHIPHGHLPPGQFTRPFLPVSTYIRDVRKMCTE